MSDKRDVSAAKTPLLGSDTKRRPALPSSKLPSINGGVINPVPSPVLDVSGFVDSTVGAGRASGPPVPVGSRVLVKSYGRTMFYREGRVIVCKDRGDGTWLLVTELQLSRATEDCESVTLRYPPTDDSYVLPLPSTSTQPQVGWHAFLAVPCRRETLIRCRSAPAKNSLRKRGGNLSVVIDSGTVTSKILKQNPLSPFRTSKGPPISKFGRLKLGQAGAAGPSGLSRKGSADGSGAATPLADDIDDRKSDETDDDYFAWLPGYITRVTRSEGSRSRWSRHARMLGSGRYLVQVEIRVGDGALHKAQYVFPGRASIQEPMPFLDAVYNQTEEVLRPLTVVMPHYFASLRTLASDEKRLCADLLGPWQDEASGRAVNVYFDARSGLIVEMSGENNGMFGSERKRLVHKTARLDTRTGDIWLVGRPRGGAAWVRDRAKSNHLAAVWRSGQRGGVEVAWARRYCRQSWNSWIVSRFVRKLFSFGPISVRELVSCFQEARNMLYPRDIGSRPLSAVYAEENSVSILKNFAWIRSRGFYAELKANERLLEDFSTGLFNVRALKRLETTAIWQCRNAKLDFDQFVHCFRCTDSHILFHLPLDGAEYFAMLRTGVKKLEEEERALKQRYAKLLPLQECSQYNAFLMTEMLRSARADEPSFYDDPVRIADTVREKFETFKAIGTRSDGTLVLNNARVAPRSHLMMESFLSTSLFRIGYLDSKQDRKNRSQALPFETSLPASVKPNVYRECIDLALAYAKAGIEGQKMGAVLVVGDPEFILDLGNVPRDNAFDPRLKHGLSVLKRLGKERVRRKMNLDGMIVIDGVTGTPHAHEFFSKQVSEGVHAGGARTRAAAWIAESADCMVIKVSADSTGEITVYLGGVGQSPPFSIDYRTDLDEEGTRAESMRAAATPWSVSRKESKLYLLALIDDLDLLQCNQPELGPAALGRLRLTRKLRTLLEAIWHLMKQADSNRDGVLTTLEEFVVLLKLFPEQSRIPFRRYISRMHRQNTLIIQNEVSALVEAVLEQVGKAQQPNTAARTGAERVKAAEWDFGDDTRSSPGRVRCFAEAFHTSNIPRGRKAGVLKLLVLYHKCFRYFSVLESARAMMGTSESSSWPSISRFLHSDILSIFPIEINLDCIDALRTLTSWEDAKEWDVEEGFKLADAESLSEIQGEWEVPSAGRRPLLQRHLIFSFTIDRRGMRWRKGHFFHVYSKSPESASNWRWYAGGWMWRLEDRSTLVWARGSARVRWRRVVEAKSRRRSRANSRTMFSLGDVKVKDDRKAESVLPSMVGHMIMMKKINRLMPRVSMCNNPDEISPMHLQTVRACAKEMGERFDLLKDINSPIFNGVRFTTLDRIVSLVRSGLFVVTYPAFKLCVGLWNLALDSRHYTTAVFGPHVGRGGGLVCGLQEVLDGWLRGLHTWRCGRTTPTRGEYEELDLDDNEDRSAYDLVCCFPRYFALAVLYVTKVIANPYTYYLLLVVAVLSFLMFAPMVNFIIFEMYQLKTHSCLTELEGVFPFVMSIVIFIVLWTELHRSGKRKGDPFLREVMSENDQGDFDCTPSSIRNLVDENAIIELNIVNTHDENVVESRICSEVAQSIRRHCRGSQPTWWMNSTAAFLALLHAVTPVFLRWSFAAESAIGQNPETITVTILSMTLSFFLLCFILIRLNQLILCSGRLLRALQAVASITHSNTALLLDPPSEAERAAPSVDAEPGSLELQPLIARRGESRSRPNASKFYLELRSVSSVQSWMRLRRVVFRKSRKEFAERIAHLLPALFLLCLVVVGYVVVIVSDSDQYRHFPLVGLFDFVLLCSYVMYILHVMASANRILSDEHSATLSRAKFELIVDKGQTDPDVTRVAAMLDVATERIRDVQGVVEQEQGKLALTLRGIVVRRWTVLLCLLVFLVELGVLIRASYLVYHHGGHCIVQTEQQKHGFLG